MSYRQDNQGAPVVSKLTVGFKINITNFSSLFAKMDIFKNKLSRFQITLIHTNTFPVQSALFIRLLSVIRQAPCALFASDQLIGHCLENL